MAKSLALGTVLSVESVIITQVQITSITTPTTNTIAAASGSFVSLGVQSGDTVTITGHGAHAHNGPALPINTVAATTLTLAGTPLVVDAVADTSFTLTIYRPIGNLNNIGVPGPVKGETDVTDFDSTAIEVLLTLPDNGEMPFAGWFNYANPGQLLMYGDANDPASPLRNFRLDFDRQDVRFTFSGYVKSFVPNAGGPNDAYTFDGSIRVSGAVTDTSPIP